MDARAAAAALSAAVAALGLVGATAPARAQSISGSAFEDLDGDGARDAGEPLVADGFTAAAFGTGFDVAVPSLDGTFTLAVPADCTGVSVPVLAEADPATGLPGGWRPALPDQTWCPPAGAPIHGLRRWSSPTSLHGNMASPELRYAQLGDSIAAGESACSVLLFQDTDYFTEVVSALQCLHGNVNAEQRAVSGAHVEDLLTPAASNDQYIPRVVDWDPHLVALSIGGNNFLDSEPPTAGQSFPYRAAELERSFRELIATRRGLQEAVSTLVSGLPDADVVLQTVYDNEADGCATTDFHAVGTALWNQMMRHLAWGQVRPVTLSEIGLDFAHQDVLRTTCCGLEDAVCVIDGIHPNVAGANSYEEGMPEAFGLVEDPGPGVTGFDIGFHRLVAVLSPASATVVAGAPSSTADALTLDGNGARLHAGDVLELSGFELPPGVTPLRIVVGVRYAASGFADDAQRADASFVRFAAPQWTFTGWDTQTPLVGGTGDPGSIGDPSVINLVPNTGPRDVAAMVTLNSVDDGRTTGFLAWPSPTAADVAQLAVRFSVTAVGASDGGEVAWDGAWAWVYGTTAGTGVQPPGEVSPPGSPEPLRVRKEAGGWRITWGVEPRSDAYRVYEGNVGDWSGSVAQPGVRGGCSDIETFFVPAPVDGGGSWYWLVAGWNAAGQGPLGARSDAVPRASGSATCP